jgi:hypothetical protein
VKRIIALIFFFYACKGSPYLVTGSGTSGDPFTIDTSYHPIIYSNEDACKAVARRASKVIDSLIILRCATTDTAKRVAYDEAVKKVIDVAMKELGGVDAARKYINTHPYKKIPCMIGDSVFLFYKDYTE